MKFNTTPPELIAQMFSKDSSFALQGYQYIVLNKLELVKHFWKLDQVEITNCGYRFLFERRKMIPPLLVSGFRPSVRQQYEKSTYDVITLDESYAMPCVEYWKDFAKSFDNLDDANEELLHGAFN